MGSRAFLLTNPTQEASQQKDYENFQSQSRILTETEKHLLCHTGEAKKTWPARTQVLWYCSDNLSAKYSAGAQGKAE